MRPLPRTILFLAASLLAASLLSWGLMQSIREPEVYDPRGGPLAVDGIWIGMTRREVACVTGLRPRESHYRYRFPGHPVDTWIRFHVSMPEGSLEDATVSYIAGSVLTQDGRILLDFRSVNRRNPSKTKDVTAALGRPNLGVENGYWHYRLLDELMLTIIVTEFTGTRGSAPQDFPAERYRLIELELDPTPPDPKGSVPP
jgi:hypothetical protein